MAYQFVSDFKLGMDSRRPLSATTEGVLFELRNAHITRGGDIEKRKAFVLNKTLPSGTLGFHATEDALYTFGSGANPGMPSGITYQRLQAPNASAMTGVLSTTNFDGKVFAVAQFADGAIHEFYDGALVTKFEDGVVTAEMVNMTGVAAAMALIIARDTAVTATPSTNTVVVEKVTNGSFALAVEAENASGGNLPTAVTAVQNVVGADETLATGSFRIVSGVVSAGVNKITSIKVNAVELLSAPIDFTVDTTTTAKAIAAAINVGVTSPDYDATSVDDSVFITAKPTTGTAPNGFLLNITTAGRFIINTGGFEVTAGSHHTGNNRFKFVRVNGVDILTGPVDFASDNTTTAAALVADINSAGVYKAFNVGPIVYLYQANNTSANSGGAGGYSFKINVDGNVEYANVLPFASTISDVGGGSAGTKEKWTITFAGPFVVGDRYTVIIDNTRYGAADNPTTKPKRVITYGSKIYGVGASLLEFSGVNTATGWNTTDDAGAGFINISTQDGGSQNLLGLEVYQGSIACFARRNIIIISVDTNPANNFLLQPVKRTGMIVPHGALSINALDTFYISDAGIRSLRARDSSSAAIAVDDIGTAIDKSVKAKMKLLSTAEREHVHWVVEPEDGRAMAILKDEAYVFTYYRAQNIIAWSIYDLPGAVTESVEFNGQVWMRAGNEIYLYGGTDNETYDSVAVTAQMSFFHGGKPAHDKNLIGFDMDCENSWLVDILTDPRNTAKRCRIGTIEEFSYDSANNPGLGTHTHLAPKFTCAAPGYARISNFALHYTLLDSE